MMNQTRPTVDFDHHSKHYALNWETIGRDLRENTPVAWTEAHGGYWILTRYEDCKRAASEWQTFTSENDVDGTGNGGGGVQIPSSTFQFALSESDPPQSTDLRRIYTPHFVQKAVDGYRAFAEKIANEAIDRAIGSGEIELARELATPVPARTNLRLVGIPDDEWELFAFSTTDMSRFPSTHPDYPREAIAKIQQKLFDLVRARRAEPRQDLASFLVHGTVMGQPMSDEMAVATISAAVFAGFDTVATLSLNMLILLDEIPELRERVRTDPRALRNAVDETLRLRPSSHQLGRTAAKDVEIDGHLIRKGERVLLVWSAANRDPTKFPDPERFDIDRANAGQHLSFSFGGHRCLGSLLGKMEAEVTVQAVLNRIGDYRIERDKVVRYPTNGSVAGFVEVPARFAQQRAQAA
jgi:cytochrome P450